MRIAILYTGEFRTCETTLPYMKQNILLNDEVDVFATIQHSDSEYSERVIKTHLGSHLKQLIHFNKTDETWNLLQDDLLHKMAIHPQTHYYLKNSGSMIEYYQAFLSFNAVMNYEALNNFQYDYIVRLRTDVIYTQPLNFNFLNMTVEDIIDNFKLIQGITQEPALLTFKNLAYFFNNLLGENQHIKKNRIGATTANLDIHTNSEQLKQLLDAIGIANEQTLWTNSIWTNTIWTNTIWESIRHYINKGKYIITLRKNVFYVIKREFYQDIMHLGLTYGSYTNPDNAYWWNAESQLQEICKVNNISIFDSTTLLEDKSLYEYNYATYFNENTSLQEHLPCLFFICRLSK